MITNAVEEFIYQNHHHKLTGWNANLLIPGKLEEYAEAVVAKGFPLGNSFGFNDGTVRPISRPGEDQNVVYNGHKRIHALKFQSVTLPNRPIAHLFGPVGISRFRVGGLSCLFLNTCNCFGAKFTLLSPPIPPKRRKKGEDFDKEN